MGTSFGASCAHEAGLLVMLRFGKMFALALQAFDETTLSGRKKDDSKARGAQTGAGGKDDEEGGEGGGD